MDKVRLGEICEFIRNGANIKNDKNKKGIPITRIETIANGIIDEKNLGYADIFDEKYKEYYLKQNDILMSHINSMKHLGKVAICKEDKKIIHGMNLLSLRLKEVIFPKYIYYFFKTDDFKKKLYKISKQSVNQSSFNVGDLKKINIYLPELQKQKQIANKLDKIQEIVDIRKKQIEKLDELIKSQFVKMFGDVIKNEKGFAYKRIDEVSTIITGTTPDTANGDFWNGNIRWITPAEIDKNTFFIEDTERKITESGRKSKSLSLMPEGTVLFTSRAPIGKTAIAGIEMCCNQGFKNCICNNKINNIYLYSVLKYNADYLDSLGTGATFRELSKSNFSKICISVPPIELQNQFADIVKQTDKQKFRLQKNLEEIQKLQECLMNKYFGEL